MPRSRVRSRFPRLAPFALMLAVAGCGPADAQSLALEPVAGGFTQPLGAVTDGREDSPLYVLEQTGAVRVVDDGAVRPEPFLDLRGDVSTGGERGLLGLAFHPTYPDPAEVFVHYTAPDGDTTLARMPVRDGRADPAAGEVMLQVSQPYANHNGGALAFGPDGHLYLGLGDGGSGGDPQGNGQDPHTLLGAMLRLDVSGDPYAIPADNPFAAGEGGRPEVWAYGLRNPWRFSFGPDGALWIADVGQNAVEEVNRQPAGAAGGANYGWNRLEGSRCYGQAACSAEGTVLPVVEYAHADGWGRSVTGGYVYDGQAIPDLRGAYVFGDYVGGVVLAARDGPDGWEAEHLLDAGFRISSFGVDADGELLVVDHGGAVHRLVAE